MKILTAEEMREADRLTTGRYGIRGAQLMERAGEGVVARIGSEFPDLKKRRIVVLCGKGNNGGDGFVAARLLKKRGAKPFVVLFGNPKEMRGDAAANLKRWRNAGGRIDCVEAAAEWSRAVPRIRQAEIIVDALLGTGLKGAATGLMAEAIAAINARPPSARVIAVDTPSGLPSDARAASGPVVQADWTVTFTAPKVGQLLSPSCESVGSLSVHRIGTPDELIEEIAKSHLRWIDPGEFRGLAFRRKADSNKGTYGHVLALAGSRGKAGAAALCGWGALRSGAGLVTVATPRDALATVAGFLPELMTAELEQTSAGTVSVANLESDAFRELIKSKSVLAIGPGLTTESETQDFVRRLIAECPLPIVVDADALNAIAAAPRDIEKRKSKTMAMTPHPGEMARLLGSSIADVQRDRLAAARACANKFNAHVVLKGFHTIVASADGDAFINSTGNPGMATAGTGDVLTGMIAGLTAQFGASDWNRILALAVYLHGMAGDFAAARYGEAPMTASDLIAAIPGAFSKLMDQLQGQDGA